MCKGKNDLFLELYIFGKRDLFAIVLQHAYMYNCITKQIQAGLI
jgi:hypothetical protein